MSQPIRLAFVITELDVGGAERCLVNLATGLDPADFQPVVYCLAPRPPSGSDSLVQQLDEASIPVHFIGVESASQVWLAIRRLRRLLIRQDPDVVQTFLFHANVVGAWAAGWRGGPALATGIRVADPARWRQRLEAWSQRKVQRIVCVSRSVADFCKDQAGFPSERLCVIPNGIDLHQYPARRRVLPEQVGLPADRRVLLQVGRLHPQKAIDWLLSLAPELLAKLPQHDLILAGDGPERANLENMAAELEISDRVRFLGWRADIADLMAAADLLLLPSRWEGMPNVILEAMASGLPVCATRADGVAELLGDLAHAQTVEIGDSEGFVATAANLANSPDRAANFGVANRQRAATHFSMTAMIAAYSKLYKELADA